MQCTPFFSRVIAAAIFTALSFAACAQAASNEIVVMTSYPEEMVTQFTAGFEKAHSNIHVKVLRRHSGEALSILRDPGQHEVDVYWAPAQRNFLTLAKEGAFRRLSLDMTGLPDRVGNFTISDPAGFYAAFEIAGYGFAVNPQSLQEMNLPEPKDWTDLADPQWKDKIVFPTPDRVGFAPLMIEILLQGYGWDKGWELLQQIGSNARLMDKGGNIADEVAGGRAVVGVSIDFFAQSAIANGAPIRFTYPGMTGYSPAQVAIMKRAPHQENARAFVAYLLSVEGQKFLFQSNLRRLPVRPAVYADKPAGYFDPFSIASNGPSFNDERALARQRLNNALFTLLIGSTQTELRLVLEKTNRAMQLANERHDAALKAKAYRARWLATTIPLSETQANTISERFTSDNEHDDVLAQWRVRIRKNREQAASLAQQVIDAAMHTEKQ